MDAQGQMGAYAVLTTALANTTTYVDSTAVVNGAYRYLMVTFNASGDSPSNVIGVGPPTGTPLSPGSIRLIWPGPTV